MLERYMKNPPKTPPFDHEILKYFPPVQEGYLKDLYCTICSKRYKSQLGKNKSKSRKTEKKKRITQKSYCTWSEEIKCDYSEMHYLFI